jgi:hypothetical protein
MSEGETCLDVVSDVDRCKVGDARPNNDWVGWHDKSDRSLMSEDARAERVMRSHSEEEDEQNSRSNHEAIV